MFLVDTVAPILLQLVVGVNKMEWDSEKCWNRWRKKETISLKILH